MVIISEPKWICKAELQYKYQTLAKVKIHPAVYFNNFDINIKRGAKISTLKRKIKTVTYSIILRNIRISVLHMTVSLSSLRETSVDCRRQYTESIFDTNRDDTFCDRFENNGEHEELLRGAMVYKCRGLLSSEWILHIPRITHRCSSVENLIRSPQRRSKLIDR